MVWGWQPPASSPGPPQRAAPPRPRGKRGRQQGAQLSVEAVPFSSDKNSDDRLTMCSKEIKKKCRMLENVAKFRPVLSRVAEPDHSV